MFYIYNCHKLDTTINIVTYILFSPETGAMNLLQTWINVKNVSSVLKVFETANSYASTFVYFSIVCTFYVHYTNISVPILTYIIFIEFISISAEVGNTVIQLILFNLY